jgi:hypothetical protein
VIIPIQFVGLLVVLSAVLGCGEPKVELGSGRADPAAPVELGPYDYIFGTADQACTTGVQRFSSLKQMCVHIQDPVRNQNCAFAERMDKFQKVCMPEGYSFHESIRCEVRFEDQFENTTSKLPYCVGYQLDGNIVASLSDRVWLAGDTALEFDASFVPEATLGAKRSGVKAELVFFEAGTEIARRKMELFRENTLGATHIYKFPDLRKFTITCAKTWACP